MATSNYTLKVNRDLLDPNFESYRLSLDAIPSYNVELDAAVEEVTLKDSQYTLEHMRAFGMYNYLHLDPWYEDSVLFVDSKGRVLSLTVTLDTVLGKPREVFRLQTEADQRENRVCPSLSLTSATWAALSDGAGRLYLLRTSKRGESTHGKWEPLFTEDMKEPFVILHSVAHVQAGAHTLEVLLLRVVKDPQETAGSGYSVTLEWVTVANVAAQGVEKNYEVKKRRVLQGKTVPHYAAVTPQGDGLMVASERPFIFTHVDGEPLDQPPPDEQLIEVEKRDPIYFWQQTSDDITVTVRLPEGVTKDAIHFRLTVDTISVGVRGFAPLLEGQLYASVDPEACTWTLWEDKSLEVSLQKRTEGPMWPELVIGDRRGEHVMSDEQVALMNERLTHLSSEDMNANPDLDKPACNSQELEDCDGYPEDTSSLMHFDGKSLKTTQVVNLGSHQFLFTVSVDPDQMPCLCLRHDVDALLWQPRPDQPADMWEHIATFNALGYVQASKRDKKFSTCAPNFSYAALCECLRRAFIYRQPSPVDGVLFNRKQGRQVGQVAKQQVANLNSDKAVLGFRASDERLFALTSGNLFVLKVNNN
ncbi:nudC domain-containing protein 1 [Corythoichthys intestinalis]|uniref:nudC domain-containing protein 1 n=1 Tax=Corythoichthys intestinalis TaxID=161448 RepID=UPI0025A68CBF|nr:nudC domain-containing protein 1 [Corythoichthys intestinalis]XP_061808600.1 nudC domain-containing protein 1-like [Nerophis lumbriciformis]